MGGEVGARPLAGRLSWWCADRLSRLLDPDERTVVWGDLVESRANAGRALRDILGLVARRQTASWRAWEPWAALLLVAVPLGVVLSFVTRAWADYDATILPLYIRRGFTWAFLQSPGVRNDVVEILADRFVECVCLIGWSWTCGFALGAISRRTRWVTGTSFVILVFAAAFGTTTTARAFGSHDIFATTFFGTLYPLLTRVVYVLLPLEWGLHVSRRRASLPLVPAVASALAIVLLTAFEARSVEGALTFGAGVLPPAGPDGFVGTADDGRPWRLAPIVMALPALYMVALALRQRRHRGGVVVVALFVAMASSVDISAWQGTTDARAARDDGPSFDVASVKVNRSSERASRLHPHPDGGMDVTNMTLRDLIEFAYQIRPFQLEGTSAWASTRYDIVAKGERGVEGAAAAGGPPTLVLKLRSLLAERFNLRVHSETRQLPIYALTLARHDGTLGPQLTRSTTDCAALMAAARANAGEAPPTGDRLQCGLMVGRGRLNAGAVPVLELTNALGWLLQRPVVDRTGLTGQFDLRLTFRPEPLPVPGSAESGLPPSSDDAPSIFTAVQEQLGLRLESTRGPVQVIVIDHVEPPTAD